MQMLSYVSCFAVPGQLQLSGDAFQTCYASSFLMPLYASCFALPASFLVMVIKFYSLAS